MLVRRPARPELAPFVRVLWTTDAPAVPDSRGPVLERVLPSGEMHLALRLSGPPFRFLDGMSDRGARVPGYAVVGGARTTPYLKEIATPALSVGALLSPGAAAHVFGAPADELAGRHTPLDALWSAAVEEIRERLFEAATASRRLDVFEAILASRVPRVAGLHPAVAHALGRLAAGARVGDIVDETGYSHRHFVAVFRDATGLTPKRFGRVHRFRRAVVRLAGNPSASHSRVALETGYADQAHLIREFREHAGVTPATYRELAGSRLHHLPVRPPDG